MHTAKQIAIIAELSEDGSQSNGCRMTYGTSQMALTTVSDKY